MIETLLALALTLIFGAFTAAFGVMAYFGAKLARDGHEDIKDHITMLTGNGIMVFCIGMTLFMIVIIFSVWMPDGMLSGLS